MTLNLYYAASNCCTGSKQRAGAPRPAITVHMSKICDLRALLLALCHEHEQDEAIPTSARFLFYELVQRGRLNKERTGARRPDQVMLDPWRGLVPLILTESRSLAGVLRGISSEYRCRIALTREPRNQTGACFHGSRKTLRPCWSGRLWRPPDRYSCTHWHNYDLGGGLRGCVPPRRRSSRVYKHSCKRERKLSTREGSRAAGDEAPGEFCTCCPPEP